MQSVWSGHCWRTRPFDWCTKNRPPHWRERFSTAPRRGPQVTTRWVKRIGIGTDGASVKRKHKKQNRIKNKEEGSTLSHIFRNGRRSGRVDNGQFGKADGADDRFTDAMTERSVDRRAAFAASSVGWRQGKKKHQKKQQKKSNKIEGGAKKGPA